MTELVHNKANFLREDKYMTVDKKCSIK